MNVVRYADPPDLRARRYVFPGGLATLIVSGGVGSYVEPNVWLLHRL